MLNNCNKVQSRSSEVLYYFNERDKSIIIETLQVLNHFDKIDTLILIEIGYDFDQGNTLNHDILNIITPMIK